MAASKGRETLIKVQRSGSFETIGGMRAKSFSINEGAVDVTDGDSPSRHRELLAAAGVVSFSISGSGVFKDSASENYILTQKLAGAFVTMQFIISGLGTFQGSFMISGLQYQASHESENQYSMSFESAGEITFTGA